MWLKSLIQSSDLQYLSKDERRKIIESVDLSWKLRLDRLRVNKDIVSLLGEKPRDELYASWLISEHCNGINNMQEWNFSFSDFWHKMYWIEISQDQTSQWYYLSYGKLYQSVTLNKIINVDNLSVTLDISSRVITRYTESCSNAEVINDAILTNNESKNYSDKFNNIPYFLVIMNWKIIWHIKAKGEKTFLSYVNAKNTTWDLVLLKWWIYVISDDLYEIIISNIIDEANWANYCLEVNSLEVSFKRIVKFSNFSEKLEWHLKRIWEKENIYIE